ncbi:MAG: AAA family ATPase [Bacilli bacterium]
MAKIISITNQKGGVGKTVTSSCLGVALAELNKKVLIIDFDPQGSLTKSFGYRDSNSYEYSLKNALLCEMNDNSMQWNDCIIHTDEKIDLIPSNISLAGIEAQLTNVMSRETVFKRVLENFKDDYDFILIDCNPSLNQFTINALTACDTVIIPVQAEPFATDGLNDLLQTIQRTKRQLNPQLEIDGILMTMIDIRTKLSKHICNEVRSKYSNHIHVFKNEIKRCVDTAEAPLDGESPMLYSPNSESSIAYRKLAKEVLSLNDKTISRDKHRLTR